MKKSGHAKRRFLKLKATVDKNRKGFAFLIFENKSRDDAFIPLEKARSLFHGDRVEVTLNPRTGWVEHLTVLEHRFREVVGRFTPHRGKKPLDGWVVYERKSAREEIYVPHAASRITGEIKPGDWVRAKLHFHSGKESQFPVTGEILDIYGSDLPPSADLLMVANEFGLEEGHTKAAEREASNFILDIEPRKSESRKPRRESRKTGELAGREDLRDLPFITIDGETARDFDDAIYVERSKIGYTVWVAIADVSHYVREGSILDQEAQAKGTSVYFPERAFHMLPSALSENLCSLRPNEPRLALVAKIDFNTGGERISTEIKEAIIESKRRATYTEIQKEWEQANRDNQAQKSGRSAKKEWPYLKYFEVFRLLNKQRKARGSLDFDLPEAEINVDKFGDVISIRTRTRFDAHRLIEEFMIAANEAVTEWMISRSKAFIFRVHGEPSAQSLEKFRNLAAKSGIKVNFENGIGISLVISDMISRLEGHPAQGILNMALLRSMKQAIYSEIHGIHFGLASRGYTHFTSPIRRYPDLVVHRLIKAELHNGKSNHSVPGRLGKGSKEGLQFRSEAKPRSRFGKDKVKGKEKGHGKGKTKNRREDSHSELEDQLRSICEHCSYRERLATDAEREAIKLKQVRAMRKHLGDEFQGKVVGMISSGLFVQLNDPYVEGLVSVESMPDDYYEFDEDQMIIKGRRKKRIFRLGDSLRVRAVRADLDRRQIDFVII